MQERRTFENRDAQEVCVNGHRTTAHYHDKPQERRKHCVECGKETIHTCQRCGAEIPGGWYVSVSPFVSHAASRATRASAGPRWEPRAYDAIPAHCEECGAAYPWTERRLASEQAAAATSQPEALSTVERVCDRFHAVVCQLQDRHEDRSTLSIEDEYDVQNLLHALLRVFFDDVRAEETTPSYAGGSSRIDFLLKREALGVEVKKTRKGLTSKALGGQLIEDIARFKDHLDCKTLVCLVYDPEDRLRNPQGLMDDLSGQRDGLTVRVLIVPRRH
jgi:hypothetical protein